MRYTIQPTAVLLRAIFIQYYNCTKKGCSLKEAKTKNQKQKSVFKQGF